MRNKGFTLIELLAVIVILAIIAIIAVPIVLNIIKDTNKNAFKESVNGIANGIKLNAIKQVIDDEILYKYENGKWVDINKEIKIDGNIPKYVEVKVNKEGNIKYAINNGEYCALKEYDSEVVIKTIGNENTDKMIQKNYCKLDAVISTDETCFNVENNADGTLTISGYNCYKDNGQDYPEITEVIIPKMIDGKYVTNIGIFGLSSIELKSVEIPNSVKSIGEYAFHSNNLTTITIPDSVTSIGNFAFEDNDLTSINIPNSVTNMGMGIVNKNHLIGENAYIYNRKVDGSIDYSTLNSYGGVNKDNVVIPRETNGVVLTHINDYAFYGILLKNVTIPNSITSIGYNAFGTNNLTSVIIPSSVITIGDYAFFDNDLTSVDIPNHVTSIGSGAFSDNELTSVTIPASVTTIGDYAFYSNDLTKIINKTDKEFNWANILNKSTTCTFKTRTCGGVTITDVEN